MGIIAFEVTQSEISLIDNDEASAISLTHAQLLTLVKYVETHPLDGHGWANHIREDGSLTGKHPCPCHNIALE